MDLDAYVAVHRPEWFRLRHLVDQANRPRKMPREELEELVELYQRVATQLSVIRSRSRDQAMVDDLSSLVIRARAAVTGSVDPGWHVVARYFTITFPAAVYARRWWAVVTTVVCLLFALACALWVVYDQTAQDRLVPPTEVAQLCNHDFASYYSENPAGSFASLIWTNNAWVAARAIAGGVLLGLPTVFDLLNNSLNLGIVGGYMSSCGESGQFFSLILPHGMLELTVVFVAGAVGLRLGWSIIAPGNRRRAEALAAEGRAAVSIAIGLAVALALSGVIEAFVTPSGLPSAVRIGIGVVAWAAFVGYIWIYGSRAASHGEQGDLEDSLGAELVPVT